MTLNLILDEKKRLILFIITSHMDWVVRETGTPKDRDEVKRREDTVQYCR
jgi:hypothetical protein